MKLLTKLSILNLPSTKTSFVKPWLGSINQINFSLKNLLRWRKPRMMLFRNPGKFETVQKYVISNENKAVSCGLNVLFVVVVVNSVD